MLSKELKKYIEATKHFDDFTLTVALNYGGISDILNAFKELQNNGLDLNEENFLAKTQLGNNDLDIFIRTGGDMRLSNFLLPNIGYSELFFTDKLWPEFTANDFEDVLKDFDERNRRFGKMKTLSIFGFTGSIGTQALDIVRDNKESFELDVLVCNQDIEKALEVVEEFITKAYIFLQSRC